MRRAVTCAMLVWVWAIGLPGLGLADDTATAQRDAQARFSEGLARVQSGNFEGARTSFAQAYAVLHKPDILWNLALAEEKCGMALAATQHFKAYSREVSAPHERAAASKHVEELAAKTGHIDVVAPAGAVVVVDGVSVGDAPLSEPVDVEPGHHHVVARTGGVAKSADAEAAAGQVVRVSFLWVAPEAPSTSAGSPPEAAPTPPMASAESRAGGAASPGGGSAGSFWTPRVVVTGSLGVAAIAAGVTGFVFGQRSLSKFHLAQSLRISNACVGATSPDCAELHNAVSAQHQAFVDSEIMWTVGGVLLAGAAVTWLVWPKGVSSASGIRVVPSVGMGAAGALASGSF
ncbi:MAG: hypothetical protein ABTD50_23800 [Polyangiaceae bacterium]